MPYGTHDFTTTPSTGRFEDFNEWWADVKKPGNGFAYSVGTAEVVDTTQTMGPNEPSFSHSPILLPVTGLGAFNHQHYKRQVVVLQCTDQTGAIVWQRYFYGAVPFPTPEFSGLATNARGISVFPANWPGAVPEDTRIAICGETYDSSIPRAGAASPTWAQNAARSSGFIAVYDGAGTLLWSRLFWGRSASGNCAITDLSVRVELVGGVPANDIVTYCGMSSHGVALQNGVPTASNGPLEPRSWFSAPTIAGCATAAGGAEDNGIGQWDGIVGRVANSHAPALPASEVVKFHAVVGGRHQDALFGIAEMDNDRFVVGGTSSTDGFQGSGNKSFPFTTPANSLGCWQSLTNGYCVGVVLRFDASGTQLVLEGTNPIGRVSTETLSHHTVARDVVVHRKAVLDGTLDQFSVVGSTDDAQMFSWVPTSLTPQGSLQGPSDGFLLTGWDQPGAGIVTFDQGWFQGDSGADGLTGVAIWNEYPDHIGALGFSQGVQSQTLDLEVASYFVDTPIPGALIPSLIRLRRQTQACPADQLPTEMGTVTATTPTSSVLNSSSAVIAVMLGLSYEENQLGSPAGGGVAIDQRGRVSVVGATTAVGFPVTGGGRQHASGIDAIRADYDMLPAGVGRTDGSGLDYTGLPVNIVATANGGTTPACMIAQFPFGSQLGMPTPPLKRMMIDYEGPAPGALVQANILVDRPPPGASIVGTFLNYGFPVGTGPIAPIPLAANPFAGTELWIDPSAWAYTLQFAPGEKSLRFPMAPMPPANTGNHRWSVQVINLLTVPVICPGTTSSLSFAASPMLVFSY